MLGATARAAARRVGLDQDRFALALAGGVFRHRSRLLEEAAIEAAAAGGAMVAVVRPELEPAVGALLLAFDAAAIEVDDAVEARLRATLPPSRLYDTHPMTAGEA
jgi:hypothetical protein